MQKSGCHNQNKYSTIAAIVLLFTLVIGSSGVYAQMFSVKSLPSRYTPPLASVYLSVVPTNFHYKPSGGGVNSQAGVFNFNDPLYRFGLDLSGLELMGTAGWNLGAQNSLNYFAFDIGFNSRYPVFHSRPFTLSLPLALKIEYTRVDDKRTGNVTNDFTQNIGTVGSGLHAGFVLPHRVRISLEGTASYGFSTRSLGQSSGSAWVIENRDRIYFDRVMGQIGIVAGFDYRFTRFNSDGIQFDYGENNAAFILGITF